MPQPPEVQAVADQLTAAYQRAQAIIEGELADLVRNPEATAARRRLLEVQRSIEAAMDHVDQQAHDWLSGEFPKVYNLGVLDGAAAAGRASSWATISRDAVTELVAGTWDDLLAATQFVREETKRLIRNIAREETTQALIRGRTALQAGRSISAEMGRQGIPAVIYANGSVHQLDEYAAMVARTKTAVAYNTGHLTAGTTWVECFDGPECGWTFHDDPEPAAGKITTADDALSWPIAHPNCRRSFGGRPDITSAKAAENAKPTPGSQAAERERIAEEARAGEASRAAGRETRVNQGSRLHADRLAAREARLEARLPAQVIDVPPITLDPAAVADALVAQASAIEPGVTGRLSGLAFRLKDTGSLARKIEADITEAAVPLSAIEAGSQVADTLRYTVVADGERLIAVQDEMLGTLTREGYDVVKYKNTWADGVAYKGINVQLASPEGQLFELQFHTPASFRMKQVTNHPMYERARLATTSPAERAELMRTQVANSATLVTPLRVRPGTAWP